MRESSSTLPSLMGTLKSTRMKTRWPWKIVDPLIESLAAKRQQSNHAKHVATKSTKNLQSMIKALARDVLDQIAHAARVTPLVVVPRKHFQHPSANHFRVLRIDDRRVRIAFEVN